MKRSETVVVKPYVSKRLRKGKNECKNKQHTETQPVNEKSASHSKAVTSIKWHPGCTNLIVSSSLDKRVVLWKISKEKQLSKEKQILEHSEGVKDVRWSADGKRLLTASFDKTCKLTDVETATCTETFGFDDMMTSAIFHPTDDNVFIAGSFSNGIYAWDIRQNKQIQKYKSFFGQVQDLMFLPDNQTFLSSAEVLKRNSLDKTIMAWDYETGAVLSTQIYPEPFSCACLKIHPSHSNFLAQSSAGYIAIFDAEKPWKMNRRKRFEGQQTGGYHIDVDVSCNGSRVYSGDTTGYLYVFDWYSTTIRKKVRIFNSPLVAVAAHPSNPNQICVGSWEGNIALWE